MPHEAEARQWIAFADRDLALAEHTAKTMWPTPHEIVCYHCQQFAEKYLKAFLVSQGQEPPYIHDLAKLVALCEAANPDFGQIKQQCIILTEYGVQPRYPGYYGNNRRGYGQGFALCHRHQNIHAGKNTRII